MSNILNKIIIKNLELTELLLLSRLIDTKIHMTITDKIIWINDNITLISRVRLINNSALINPFYDDVEDYILDREGSFRQYEVYIDSYSSMIMIGDEVTYTSNDNGLMSRYYLKKISDDHYAGIYYHDKNRGDCHVFNIDGNIINVTYHKNGMICIRDYNEEYIYYDEEDSISSEDEDNEDNIQLPDDMVIAMKRIDPQLPLHKFYEYD